MEKLEFKPSPAPTVGIELELALVDAETMALSSAIARVLKDMPEELSAGIKPEAMQCYVELNTDVCHTIAQAEGDLRRKLEWLEQRCDEASLRLLWTGTHPFSLWREQKTTPNDRYEKLIALLQDMARQLVCFGLHVHVGVDSGDKAVMICDRIMRHLPTLLALSANSPWWDNRMTGLRSHRSKIMEDLPTAGLPPLMRNWSEYVWLIKHLIHTGFIHTIREIWWDVRPHHNFGTVEVRVCDIPGSLEDSLALAALIHCLVKALSDDIDEGAYQHDCHPMLVRQNKWLAARYGLDARLVDEATCEAVPVRQKIESLVRRLEPFAVDLKCGDYLERAAALAAGSGWADRQLEAFGRSGDLRETVRELSEASRVGARDKSSSPT